MTWQTTPIGTTEHTTDDTMKTHILTTVSDISEPTLQILGQWISTPTVQQCMVAIRKHAEYTALTRRIGGASTRVVVYFFHGECGHSTPARQPDG